MKQHPTKTKLMRVRADSLEIHPTAQRTLIKSHVQDIYDHFNFDALGTLHAVPNPRFDGKLLVVDGQHRLAAMIKHGFGEWVVNVLVHLEVNTEAEANELFLKLNRRKPQTAFQVFTASVRAKHSDAVSVSMICSARGLNIKPGTADNAVACVGTLLRMQRLDGGETLNTTLAVIYKAWGFESASLEGVIIEGLAKFLHKHKGSVDLPSLIAKLAKYPGKAGGLHGDAKGRIRFRRTSVTRCVSEIVTETYNLGRRGSSRLS